MKAILKTPSLFQILGLQSFWEYKASLALTPILAIKKRLLPQNILSVMAALNTALIKGTR